MSTYKNIRKLGTGGFGEVYECETGDGKLFARKVLKGSEHEDVARFLTEVRILSKLDHPNIIKVTAKYLSAAPYSFVMPKYNCSLADCFPSIVNDEKRIVPIFTAVLNAIEFAHSQGVLHRDLKTSNVLLNSDTEVVVTDFGLGRIMGSDSARKTQSGIGFGTFGYSPPEQYEEGNAKNADERSDIYCLGLILYELYIGLLNGSQADFSLLTPRIRLLVESCVKLKPEERYPNVETLKRVWLAITGQTDEAAGKLLEVAAQLSSPGSADDDLLEQFIILLAQHEADPDVLQEAFLTASPKTIALIAMKKFGFTVSLLDKFLEHLKCAQWPTGHSTKLSVFCNELIDEIDDVDSKCKLIGAMLFLAQQSKVFKTQKAVKKRLLETHDAATNHAIETHVRAIPREVALHTYRQIAGLDSLKNSLRSAFECAILQDSNEESYSVSSWNTFLREMEQKHSDLAAKLKEYAHLPPTFKLRTILLKMKNAPIESLSYQTENLERFWNEIVGNSSVFILIP